jgi:hypothetical protein
VTKYYVVLFLAFALVLLFVFAQDPCSSRLRTDFQSENPTFEILDTGAESTSTDSVSCRIRYREADSAVIYEDLWLYRNAGNGWSFAKILEARERTE